MTLTPEQRAIKREVFEGIERVKQEAIEKFLSSKCTVVSVQFEERPFVMATDKMYPTQGCPSRSGCCNCNDCGYYITHNKSLGVVYCIPLSKAKTKRKTIVAANKIGNRR